jgi:hypothetical protein
MTAHFVVTARVGAGKLYVRGIQMMRDMNLVREILKWASEQEESGFDVNPSFDEYTDEQVDYHIYIMWRAGLVEAIDVSSIGDSRHAAMLSSVTWAGHDFLDVAKDNRVWEKAKKNVLSSGASFTFDLLKDLLILGAKGPLGLP